MGKGLFQKVTGLPPLYFSLLFSLPPSLHPSLIPSQGGLWPAKGLQKEGQAPASGAQRRDRDAPGQVCLCLGSEDTAQGAGAQLERGGLALPGPWGGFPGQGVQRSPYVGGGERALWAEGQSLVTRGNIPSTS